MSKHACVRPRTVVAALWVALSAPVVSAAVGVSVSVIEPGIYGRIDIGMVPQAPAVVNVQPVIYAPPRVTVVQQPVYLYVPPGHQKNWGKHCSRYNACGVPVYFVQESWVRARYESDHPPGRGNGNGNGNGRGNGYGRP